MKCKYIQSNFIYEDSRHAFGEIKRNPETMPDGRVISYGEAFNKVVWSAIEKQEQTCKRCHTLSKIFGIAGLKNCTLKAEMDSK